MTQNRHLHTVTAIIPKQLNIHIKHDVPGLINWDSIDAEVEMKTVFKN